MDYDVAAVSLSSPPAVASLTTYRPAILVRNNGLYPAVAYGDIQAYKAGLRVWFSHVESAAIAPGETGIATADDDWEPDTEGDYTFFGYVNCHNDQVETNNQLAPITINVGPEPPPPPPPVPTHATQHEHGGSDVLDVDQLAGKLRDEQTPEAHAARHQAAGDDQLNVAGLAGVLGEAQVPTDHGNEAHSTDFASMDELDNHRDAATVHTAATNLANRETTGPLTGRVPQAQLQLGTAVQEDPADDLDAMGLRIDRDMGYVNPAHHAYKHDLAGVDPIPALVPVGLICLWADANPNPAGWVNSALQSGQIGYKYIEYQPL
jgi:hypothetical protein